MDKGRQMDKRQKTDYIVLIKTLLHDKQTKFRQMDNGQRTESSRTQDPGPHIDINYVVLS